MDTTTLLGLLSVIMAILCDRDRDWKKLSPSVGSERCIAKSFCKRENAKNALIEHFTGIQDNDVEEILNITFGYSWRTCSCSPSCKYFGTCCEDADAERTAVHYKTGEYGCAAWLGYTVPVINTCPESYRIQVVRDQCQRAAGKDEPFGLTYMTDPSTSLTYQNIYCAMCNNIGLNQLSSWSWNIFPTYNCTENNTVAQLRESGCRLDPLYSQRPPDNLPNILTFYGTHADIDSRKDPCKKPLIDRCLSGSSASDMDECENGKVNYVTYNKSASTYKNPACARCNNAMQAEFCQVCTDGCRNKPYGESGISASFSVLVNPYAGQSTADKYAARLGGSCSEGKFRNFSSGACQDICTDGTVYHHGLCANPEQDMREPICAEELSYDEFIQSNKGSEGSVTLNGETFMSSLPNGGMECHFCKNLIRDDITSSKYVRLENGSISLNGIEINKVFVMEKGNISTMCRPPSPFDLSKVGSILTITMIIISLIAMILFFVGFCLNKRMRNVPGAVIAGQMAMFFIAYLVFLCRLAMNDAPNAVACYAVSVIVFYCFLSAFLFTIIYAVLILRSLQFAEFDSRARIGKVLGLWCMGLLLPFLILIPALIVDQVVPTSYRPYFGGRECFMDNQKGMQIFFIAPIGFTLLITLTIYAIVVKKLVNIARATSQVRSDHREKILLCIKLVFVLGFSWIFAILAAFVAHPVTQILFILACCSQGLFGFLVFVISQSNVKIIKTKLISSKSQAASNVANTSRSKPANLLHPNQVTSDTYLMTSSTKSSPVMPRAGEESSPIVSPLSDKASPRQIFF